MGFNTGSEIKSKSNLGAFVSIARKCMKMGKCLIENLGEFTALSAGQGQEGQGNATQER